MERIYSEAIRKVKSSKKKIERVFNVKISFEEGAVCVEGDAIDENKAIQALEAINLGFKLNEALMLKDEEIILEVVNIKDLTKRNDLQRVRARIIGTSGKTKEIMENLSSCIISVKDNRVGIIGEPENIKDAINAVIYVIQGAKQGNVYSFLEKERRKAKLEVVEDLGLKYKPKKRKKQKNKF